MLFQSFLGNLFVPVCEIDVVLNDAETRKPAEIKTEDGKVEKHFLFYDGESVSGKVNFYLKVAINYCTDSGMQMHIGR